MSDICSYVIDCIENIIKHEQSALAKYLPVRHMTPLSLQSCKDIS